MPTYANAAVRDAGPMGKAMSIAGMVIGGLIAVIFALDLVIGVPFGTRGGAMVDIGFALCGAIVAYLGWNAFRDSPS
jgi:hypothetical protein